MYPENGYNFGLGINRFYANGLFSSLNFVEIMFNRSNLKYYILKFILSWQMKYPNVIPSSFILSL